MSQLIVAIDGPSASGKSTVSRQVAARLNCVYIDSGALYRGLTWQTVRAGVPPGDDAGVVRAMERMRLEYFLEAGAARFRIDGADPGAELRSAAVRERVSAVAAIPRVREWMVRQLRELTRFGDLVMEGRDIGTVVFPETPFKFFLDADPAERARRRCLEISRQEGPSDVSDVQQSLARRDALDSTRTTAPLKVAPGALVIDTTAMPIAAVVAMIVAAVHQGGAEMSGDQFPLVYRLSRLILRLWARIIFRYRAYGVENVPAEGGCLIASNHASFLDPPLVGIDVKHRFVRFMARETLFQRSRISSWWADQVGVVRIDRTRGDVAALKAAIALLKSGGVLSVFPEGTRTLDGNLQPAKGGVGFLIAKAGVPVVPAYIDGNYAALPKGAFWIRPVRIRVYFGRPITPAEVAQTAGGKGGYERIAALVMERIAELKRQAER